MIVMAGQPTLVNQCGAVWFFSPGIARGWSLSKLDGASECHCICMNSCFPWRMKGNVSGDYSAPFLNNRWKIMKIDARGRVHFVSGVSKGIPNSKDQDWRRRLFRYPVPSSESEFALNLRRWVVQTFTDDCVIVGDVLLPERRTNYGLLRLYGQSVFPQELQDFLNADCFNCGMCAPVLNGQKISPLCEGSCITFYIGGFWFMKISRACCLMLAKLLKMPVGIFSLHLVQPRAQNAKRLKAFQEFFDSDAHQSGLWIAVLCLRLTSLATNLVAKCSGAIPCCYYS